VQIFAEDDDLDSTRISQATAEAMPWSLVISDGQRLTVDAPVVIGRDPVVPASVSMGRAVPVADQWKSVSKTHAVIEVRDGMLWVTDLHSTNGTTITNAVGEAMSCPPGVAMPVGHGWTISAAEVSIVASLGV
jgi:pSer/pThr/pTyr-binding forkhead associated (FHA) protein